MIKVHDQNDPKAKDGPVIVAKVDTLAEAIDYIKRVNPAKKM